MKYKASVVNGIYLVEIGAAVYGAFVFWLMSVWMTHDFIAVEYSELDWWLHGAKRFLAYGGVGAIIGWFIHAANSKAIKAFAPTPPVYGKYVGACVGALLVIASLIGSVQFAIQKPYM
ncbi:hypothetical protein ACFL0R_02405 [Pseudomonadota bacterium]